MKSQKAWMAIVAFENEVSFAKCCKSQRKAESAIVQHLKQNEGFDGKSFNDVCFWIGEKDLRLDLMVFEMEQADFDDLQFYPGYMVEPPPKEHGLFRVAYEIDVNASDTVKAAQEAWEMMRSKDAVDPVFTLIDPKGIVTTLDLFDVLEFSKITPGFVTQRYRKGSDGKYQCLWQEFTAGDDVQYENSKGDTVKPPNYDYQEFNMTLLSDSQIVFYLREVLRTLDVGGEQSRQFSGEIKILAKLVSELDRTKK